MAERYRLGLVALVLWTLAGTGALLFWLRSPAADLQPVAPAVAAAIDASGPPRATSLDARRVRTVEAPPHTTWDPVAVYAAQSVYPPDSRPLRWTQRHRIEWNRRHESPRPLPDGAGQWLLTADRYHVIGDAALTVSARAWNGAGPLPVRLESGWVEAGDLRRPLRFVTDGDGLVAVFWPESLPGTDVSRVLRVAVRLADGTSASINAIHTPRARFPARFTGALTDGVEGGGLRVDVGIEVARAGRFLIDANLYDQGGDPVGWARFKGELDVGQATVPLRFFGKVLTDAGRAGPYRLGELRGARYQPGQHPDLEQMPPWPKRWSTRPWPLDSFSAAAWDSPKRRARLAALRRLPGPAPPKPRGDPRQ